MRKNLKKNYSIKKKLRLEKKIDEDFEIRLNHLTLEDIIALKLELSSKNYKGKLSEGKTSNLWFIIFGWGSFKTRWLQD